MSPDCMIDVACKKAVKALAKPVGESSKWQIMRHAILPFGRVPQRPLKARTRRSLCKPISNRLGRPRQEGGGGLLERAGRPLVAHPQPPYSSGQQAGASCATR